MFDTATAIGVLGADPAALGDDDLAAHTLATIALVERAAAAALAAVGEFDARALWSLDGAVGPGPWLAARAELSGRDARGIVGAARALRRTTAVAAALGEGDLNVGQAKALASVRTARTAELFDIHEEDLVEAARSLSVDDTIRLARRWQLAADTDGPPPDDDDQTARLSPAYEGRWRLDANLNPEGGLIVRNVWSRSWRSCSRRPPRMAPPRALRCGDEPTPWWRWPAGPAPPTTTAPPLAP